LLSDGNYQSVEATAVENVGQIIEFALQGEQIGRMGNRKNVKKAGE